MRILITGAAGHIGSKLARYIEAIDEHELVLCDDLSCGYPENPPGRLLVCDAGDPKLINDHGPFDAVYHLAAYAAECMSPFCRGYNYSNNLVTTSRLVSNLIAGDFKGRLVFASSIAVYGDLGAPFHETMICVPKDPYGNAKLACERDIQIAGEQHGLDWCILRPHNVYGPGQSLWQRYRNVLGLWMRAAFEEQPIVIFGSGNQTRAFSYIDDILPPMLNAAVCDGASKQVINLGGSTPISISALYGIFSNITKYNRVQFEPARHEVKHAYCTVEKSEKLLNYWDLTSMSDGIRSMWNWARDAWGNFQYRRDHPVRPTLDDIEVITGMPEIWQRDLGISVQLYTAVDR